MLRQILYVILILTIFISFYFLNMLLLRPLKRQIKIQIDRAKLKEKNRILKERKEEKERQDLIKKRRLEKRLKIKMEED